MSFNPRAPRGARPLCAARPFFQAGFQSTRPARGATATQGSALAFGGFNPRAPRGARRIP